MNSGYQILWLAPVLASATGVLLSLIKDFRKIRYCVYFVILFIAFLFDLMSLSFTSDIMDTVFLLIVALSLSEIYWKLFRFKNRVFYTLSVVIGLFIFIFAFKPWFSGGPENVKRNWESQIVSEHTRHAVKYTVKEIKVLNKKRLLRKFRVNKNSKYLPLEKLIGTYTVPEGYYNAEFRFNWTTKENKFGVDLIGDKDVLWTIGEGF